VLDRLQVHPSGAVGHLYLADPAGNHHIIAHRASSTLVADEHDTYPSWIGAYSLMCPLDGTWLLV
jgi:hypothetical protein